MEAPAVPRHIALIMDGNGRWAKARGLPRTAGHKAAASRVRELVKACGKRHIEVLTLFAFSSENWLRPPEEVGVLMGLYLYYLRNEIKALHRNGVKIKMLGEMSALSPELQAAIIQAETLTQDNTGLQLNLAVNYGGRADILQAIKSCVQEVLDDKLSVEQLTEAEFSRFLYTGTQPEPDLFIRTSGVTRISNFLLWQLAYTELYFTDIPFPDFDAKALDIAIEWFRAQPRRFGKTNEQLEKPCA